jgi:hypothetical protein
METRSKDGPTCPYCNALITPDEAFYYSEDYTKQQCYECNKTYSVSVFHSITWTCKARTND